MKPTMIYLMIIPTILVFFTGCPKHNEPCVTCPPVGTDTTSHNFTFQTFTFGGDAGSCDLNDVAIINDTLAYAVGSIYLNDSTTGQPDPQPYNFAVWDGKVWKIQKIPYYYQGQPFYGPIYSLWAFNANDILVWYWKHDPLQWSNIQFS